MCGIYGFMADLPDPAATIDKMQAALLHRGPDHQGTFLDGRVGLGGNRLSILDLTAAGNQPVIIENGEYVLVFNGEIYNYIELRDELDRETFSSTSDSEVVLRGYMKWGKQVVSRLIGMFAFSIWDGNRQELFLARDRFGIKPLYYSRQPHGFFFSSEPKGLFAAGIGSSPDTVSWSTYLTYGTYEHSRKTFFREVSQLEPGHTMSLRNPADLRIASYYDLAKVIGHHESKIEDKERACREYGDLLESAVRICLRSDVPVGIALSGGVDSSLLISTIGSLVSDQSRVSAFTYTCDHPDYDETPLVKQLLKKKEHPWHVTRLSTTDVADLLIEVARNQEEPYGGLNTICLSELCRTAGDAGVTVLLDGNGLDEQWAGYEYYTRTDWSESEFVSGPVQASTTLPCRPNCLTHEMRSLAEKPTFDRPFDNMLDNLRYRDIKYTKIPRALRFSDRASMMHSRELRVPFLDHRLVEYAFRVSPSLMIRRETRKYLIRKIADKLLPGHATWEAKRPLQTPQREWLAGELSPLVGDLIHSETFRKSGWFELKSIEREWQNFRNSPPDNSFFIWQWMSVALLAT